LYIPDWKEEVEKTDKELMLPWGLKNEGEIGFITLNETDVKGADVEISRIRSHTNCSLLIQNIHGRMCTLEDF